MSQGNPVSHADWTLHWFLNGKALAYPYGEVLDQILSNPKEFPIPPNTLYTRKGMEPGGAVLLAQYRDVKDIEKRGNTVRVLQQSQSAGNTQEVIVEKLNVKQIKEFDPHYDVIKQEESWGRLVIVILEDDRMFFNMGGERDSLSMEIQDHDLTAQTIEEDIWELKFKSISNNESLVVNDFISNSTSSISTEEEFIWGYFNRLAAGHCHTFFFDEEGKPNLQQFDADTSGDQMRSIYRNNRDRMRVSETLPLHFLPPEKLEVDFPRMEKSFTGGVTFDATSPYRIWHVDVGNKGSASDATLQSLATVYAGVYNTLLNTSLGAPDLDYSKIRVVWDGIVQIPFSYPHNRLSYTDNEAGTYTEVVVDPLEYLSINDDPFAQHQAFYYYSQKRSLTGTQDNGEAAIFTGTLNTETDKSGGKITRDSGTGEYTLHKGGRYLIIIKSVGDFVVTPDGQKVIPCRDENGVLLGEVAIQRHPNYRIGFRVPHVGSDINRWEKFIEPEAQSDRFTFGFNDALFIPEANGPVVFFTPNPPWPPLPPNPPDLPDPPIPPDTVSPSIGLWKWDFGESWLYTSQGTTTLLPDWSWFSQSGFDSPPIGDFSMVIVYLGES